MAKRTIPSVRSGSHVTAAAAAVPSAGERSVCSSLADEREPFQDLEQQVRLSSEESLQPDTSTLPSPTPLTTETHEETSEWSFLCPFCSSAKLADPVELHAPAKGECEPEACHCLACRICAERWYAAMRVLSETTSFVPSSSPSAVSAPCLTCPLCDRAIVTVSTATDSGVFASPCGDTRCKDGCALLRQPELVRNCYTGLLPLANCGIHTAGRKEDAAVAKDAQFTTNTAAVLYCGVCEEQKATCMCVQCDFGLCDECRAATHSKGKFRLHEVVGLDQARRRDHLKCPEHAGMSLDLYCETCATCVCVTCCFGGAHRGHEVFPLADVTQRTADGLKNAAQELSAPREKSAAALTDLAALSPQYDTKIHAVEVDIQRCFASLRRTLQEREDALLTCLHHTAAEVKQRSTTLQEATGALAMLLTEAMARLSSFYETVSPATLMRVAPRVQEQQVWTLHAASRLAEEAAAAVDGWKDQLGDEHVNGCRMVCFDMLNAQTPNVKGILQYQQVLGDLGRLEVSDKLQPPTTRKSGEDSELTQVDDTNGELVPFADNNRAEEDEVAKDGEDEEQRPQSPAAEKSVAGPIVEVQPESPRALQSRREESVRYTSVSSFNKSAPAKISKAQDSAVVRRVTDVLDDDVPRLRLSHVSETAAVPPSAPETSLASCSTEEMHLTSGTIGGVNNSRVAALRSATSTRPSLPRSLVIGNTREEASFVLSATSRTTSQIRAALDALERKEAELAPFSSSSSCASHLYTTGGLRLRSDDAVNMARDTVPFRVSLPPKRMPSLDSGDDALTSASASASQPWRALKRRRTSLMRDTASSAELTARTPPLASATCSGASGASSAWQPSGSTRLSFFADFEVCKLSKSNGVSPVRGLTGDSSAEEQRGTVKRKTTGLQLEL